MPYTRDKVLKYSHIKLISKLKHNNENLTCQSQHIKQQDAVGIQVPTPESDTPNIIIFKKIINKDKIKLLGKENLYFYQTY